MALVVPGICRYSIIQSYLGQEVVNIVDVDLDTAPGQSRPDFISVTASDIIDNWNDHVLPKQVAALRALEVRWVDLDAEDGTTGAKSSTDNTTWPAVGGKPEPGLPGNAVARVRKNLQGGNRQSRRGEVRLAGVAEGMTEPENGNLLRAIFVADLDGGFEGFKDGINGAGIQGTANVAQVHNPKDGTPSSSHISTFSTLSTIGTQRRRMPGYGD